MMATRLFVWFVSIGIVAAALDEDALQQLITRLKQRLASDSGPAEASVDKRLLDVSSRGESVVSEVVKRIQDSNLFPDDNGFMKRVAYLETRNGENMQPNTGGMWKVSREAFDDTHSQDKHKRLEQKMEKIKREFGLDWKDVTYRDLDSPFHSGLAARLFLSNDPAPLPEERELELQSRYWADKYHAGLTNADRAAFELRKRELTEQFAGRAVADQTTVNKRLLDPTAGGANVVSEVVKRIQDSKLFPDDNGFMRRVAYLETRDGANVQPNNGGVFKVSRKALADTQNNGETFHKRLGKKMQRIAEEFGINWNDVTYRDLDSPFMSGLAARLFVSNDPEPLPEERELELQTRYWANSYHNPGVAEQAARDLKARELKQRELEEPDKKDVSDVEEKKRGLLQELMKRLMNKNAS